MSTVVTVQLDTHGNNPFQRLVEVSKIGARLDRSAYNHGSQNVSKKSVETKMSMDVIFQLDIHGIKLFIMRFNY